MKTLLKLLLVALFAVAAVLAAKYDPGYVLIVRDPWSVELSFALFVILAVVGFAAIYLTTRLIANTWSVSRRLHDWSERRRARRARASLLRGLMAFAERNWSTAEKNLTRHVADSETPIINYLAAAMAAQELAAYERRDQYLYNAHEAMPSADIAVGLTQAELQLRHRQLEQAEATLVRLRELAPKHPHVLKLITKLYEALEDWQHLLELLPDIRKRGILSAERYSDLEKNTYMGLVKRAVQTGTAHNVQLAWSRVPKTWRNDADLLRVYVEHLIRSSECGTAETLLRDALKNNWQNDLVYLYGWVPCDDHAKQLSNAERWLKEHPRDATLLLTLGRLCVKNELWGKARGYLEASLGVEARPESYRLLGELLEKLEEPGDAAECYRKGLIMADDKQNAALLGGAA